MAKAPRTTASKADKKPAPKKTETKADKKPDTKPDPDAKPKDKPIVDKGADKDADAKAKANADADVDADKDKDSGDGSSSAEAVDVPESALCWLWDIPSGSNSGAKFVNFMRDGTVTTMVISDIDLISITGDEIILGIDSRTHHMDMKRGDATTFRDRWMTERKATRNR